MKPKQIIILSVILGILVLGILLKSWIRSVGDSAGARQGDRVALTEFDPAKLERILISRPARTGGSQTPAVELTKENGVWKVKSLWGAQADPEKVEAFLERLRSMQGELRGSGKKLFADFGIQDAEAFSIKLFGTGNALLQDLRLGTKQAGEHAYFIRQATSEKVYFVEANIAELLGMATDFNEAIPASLFWADLSLFNFDPEKVSKITLYLLKGEERTMIMGLERETDPQSLLKSPWKFLRKDMTSSLDPDKVLKFIARMKSIKAGEVVDPDAKGYGLEKPVWQLAVTEAGKKTLLNAGPKDEKGGLYYVKRSGSPTVFGLQVSFFDDLNVDDTFFVKEVPPVTAPKEGAIQDIPAALQEVQEQGV